MFLKKIPINQSIRIDKISYTYPETNKIILNSVSFNIKKNTTVAIVGLSGSGKTTLVDLIMGLLTPSSGNIIVDNTVVNRQNLKMWQQNIGYVPQSIYLTDDSIINNIAFSKSKKDIDLDQVYSAAKLAHLDDYVSQLPDKYHTIVGEHGVRLSGGQIQRIGIARAIYSQPDLLILDEATSSLDGHTENAVMQAVHNLSHKMTIIMIAHRLTTIKECDEIFVIKDGKNCNSGTYEHLLAHDEEFRKLANLYHT